MKNKNLQEHFLLIILIPALWVAIIKLSLLLGASFLTGMLIAAIIIVLMGIIAEADY